MLVTAFVTSGTCRQRRLSAMHQIGFSERKRSSYAMAAARYSTYPPPSPSPSSPPSSSPFLLRDSLLTLLFLFLRAGVSYDNKPPWPQLADGFGSSLELLCLDPLKQNSSSSWTASLVPRTFLLLLPTLSPSPFLLLLLPPPLLTLFSLS